MSIRNVSVSLCSGLVLTGLAMFAQAAEPDSQLDEALANIEHRFDELSFATSGKRQRRAGFESLLEDASELVSEYPNSAEALIWQGIVQSTYAGEVSVFSAMKYAEAARDSLQTAEAMNASAMGASVYTSLGALYSQVPGGLMGFGDDELALEYLRKAVTISPNDLDANFFLAELLIDKGMYAEAEQLLNRVLASPRVVARPLLDAARRGAMQTMLEEIES